MDIKGWDLIFGCSRERVNAQLAANQKKLISSFLWENEVICIQGEFGPWQMELHGANQLLRFTTPIQAGTLTLKRGTNQVIDLSGVQPEMELQLDFIDNVDTTQVKELKFNCKVAGKQPGDRSPGAVTCVTPDSSGKITPQTAPLAWSMLNDHLAQVFIANQNKLAYVFAQLNAVAPGSNGWMAPQKYVYSYYEPVGKDPGQAGVGAEGAAGYLVIFSLLTDRDLPTRLPSVDGDLFDTQHELFLMIASGKFLEHILLPLLPQAYGHGATAANFAYQPCDPNTITVGQPVCDETFGQIVNRGNLGCDSVRVGLIDYYPYVTDMTLTVEDNAVNVATAGRATITGMGSDYISFTIHQRNPVTYNPTTGKLSMQADPNPSANYERHISAGGLIAMPLINLIANGIVDVMVSKISQSITGAVSTSQLNGIGEAAPAAVRWNGLEHFQVTAGKLNTALALRGNYQ